MAPALMGQEASAETFDHFFLVTCPKMPNGNRAKAGPALFSFPPENFKRAYPFIFYGFANPGTNAGCFCII